MYMELEEILQKEKRNEEYIFLYQEDGNWYAYEHSAFYCYSLLGILDIDWLWRFSLLARINTNEISRIAKRTNLRSS